MVLPCLPDPPRYLFPRRSRTTTSATRLPSRITSTVNTKTSVLSSLFRLFARHLAATPSLPRYVLSDTMPPSSREILIPTFFLPSSSEGWGKRGRRPPRGQSRFFSTSPRTMWCRFSRAPVPWPRTTASPSRTAVSGTFGWTTVAPPRRCRSASAQPRFARRARTSRP